MPDIHNPPRTLTRGQAFELSRALHEYLDGHRGTASVATLIACGGLLRMCNDVLNNGPIPKEDPHE